MSNQMHYIISARLHHTKSIPLKITYLVPKMLKDRLIRKQKALSKEAIL